MRSHRGLCKLLVPPSFAQPRWSCRLDLHVNSNKMGYKWDVKNTLSNVRSFGGLDLLLNIGHVTGLHLKVIKNRDESLYWNLYEPFVLRFTSPCEGCELLLNIHQCSAPPLLKYFHIFFNSHLARLLSLSTALTMFFLLFRIVQPMAHPYYLYWSKKSSSKNRIWF